jgi:tetratricopeptide (TPR) repeat protein
MGISKNYRTQARCSGPLEIVQFGRVPPHRLKRKLMDLASTRLPLWSAVFVRWLVLCGIKSLQSTAATMLEEVPRSTIERPTAIRLTLQVAWQHERFRSLIRQADELKDQSAFETAEVAYRKALAIFPLHRGYQVQLGHSLKEQQKYIEAFFHYCLALSMGERTSNVAEHLLFAASQAGIRASIGDIERLVSAWAKFERTLDAWDAPPIEIDFTEFARLLWGNAGLVTAELRQTWLLKCVTRKELFISFLRTSETRHRNARLFIFMKERGLNDV